MTFVCTATRASHRFRCTARTISTCSVHVVDGHGYATRSTRHAASDATRTTSIEAVHSIVQPVESHLQMFSQGKDRRSVGANSSTMSQRTVRWHVRHCLLLFTGRVRTKCRLSEQERRHRPGVSCRFRGSRTGRRANSMGQR
jgi:hypothetical protein